MLKKLTIPIVVLICAAIGGGSGFIAKTKLPKASAKNYVESDTPSSNEKQHSADSQHSKNAKKSKNYGKGASNTQSYMKFSRQFVVPVVENGTPVMIMILDINIAIDGELSESVYRYEPQLRDAMLSSLLALASEGVLAKAPEDKGSMSAVKASLLQSAHEIIGEGATEILILDIGLQSY